jgi:3-deoxy-D-manno-octulosonic-acid transferase
MFGALVTSPYWFFKALKEKKYFQNIRQRFGWKLPDWSTAEAPLWIHAVSVGEVLAAKALLSALQKSQPSLPVIVSTVTLTGHALSEKELKTAAAHFFFPFDWKFCITHFLDHFQPRAVVLMETELWPNFIKCCAMRNIPVFLANGRISDRSRKRYAMVRRVFKDVLSQISVIGVQSAEDKRRFAALGASEARVHVTGNLKFDFTMPSAANKTDLLERIRAGIGISEQSLPIVVGSSMKGEEPLLLQAFLDIHGRLPDTRLILAPRHPERFEEVARLIADMGLPFLRRSALQRVADPRAQVFLLDSIGELRLVYSLAAVAVIGGSFLPFGGHNLLEPAALGKAIIFGPHMFNFKEAAQLFLQEQAARQCSPEDLVDSLAELLQNERGRRLLGQRALYIVRQNQGAAASTCDFLTPYIAR